MHAVSSGFAASLVSIFIPIYLLKIGNSLLEVMIFLIVQHTALLGTSFFAVFFSNRRGLVWTLRVRFLFLFIYLFLLYLLRDDSVSIPIYFVAIIGGIEAALYWIPINVLFTRYADEKAMAKQMSHFFVLPEALSLAAPIIGGVVASYFGFPALFVFAFIVNILALYFLRGLHQEKTNFQFSLKRFKQVWQNNKPYFISEFFDNISEETVGIIFPIVAWFNLQNLVDIGLVGTFLSLGMMAFTFIIGRFADKYDKKKMLRIGAFLLIITWIAALYTHSQIGFYIISILLGFFLRFFLVPYNALLYANAKKDDAQFLVLREFSVVSARVVVFAFAIILASQLELTFIISLVSLFYFFIFNPPKRLV